MDYLYLIWERPGLSALQHSHWLQTTESQVRKLAAFTREKLPDYYATQGRGDTIYLEHSHRGYTLEARRINPLAMLSPEDQELFNHGTNLREILTATTSRAALAIFEELRHRYPLFATLCVGLADVHTLLDVHCVVPSEDAYSLAERYALQAIALEPNLWTGHAALCIVRTSQWRWADARAALEPAESLSPIAALHYAQIAYHGPMHQLDAYITRLEPAQNSVDLRPLAFHAKANLGLSCLFSGQPRRSQQIWEGLLQMFPAYHLLHIEKAIAHFCLGDDEAALAHLDKAMNTREGKYFAPGLRAYCLAHMGRRQEAPDAVEAMKQGVNSDYLGTHEFACAYSGLREEEMMFECLEQAVADHDIQASFLHAWPHFFAYHGHPRFRALFTEMSLTPI